MNRVIQGQYAPGSIFKIVMATAGLEEGVITPSTTFYCPGHLSVYNTVFRCNVPAGHGLVNVEQALAQSCNVFFYNLGIRLEIARIAAWAKKMGLGAPTGVDLPHELGRPHPEPGVEDAHPAGAVVRRGDGVRGHRPGAGQRDPAPARAPRRDRGQRRAPGPPPPRALGGRGADSDRARRSTSA